MNRSADWIAAARTLTRLGFGTTAAEVDATLSAGLNTVVVQRLRASTASDPGAQATPPPTFTPMAPLGKSPDRASRSAAKRTAAEHTVELTRWWLHRMVTTQNPTIEKLTLLWHNHFATSAQKVRDPHAMLAQNQTLRALGRGQFRPLAYAMLTDPAMLKWLDGGKNTRRAPNENLSREFMELFALGHGAGYTESDVRDGARALTGWHITPAGTAQVRARLHDNGIKSVLGVRGDLDAAGFCDAVLDHPGSAAHVATRMWRQIASDTDPSAATLRRLTDAYGSRRDISALVNAIVGDPEFIATSRVRSPVEWLVGATRALSPQVQTADLTAMAFTLRQLGQLPFYPPNVGGWPAGQGWLSTAAAQTRLRAATRLASTPQNTTVVDAAPGDRIDAIAEVLGLAGFTDRTAAVLRPLISRPPSLIATALVSPEYLTA
ncbi:DUF1800 domain-containing protein [Williamsia sp. CHRR-6]|uniref:DUF1800 domain-containing protein n=1 Tax=Williamsia sp. CHRR-6 TaxID=2835871 RepID=UPI001BD9A3F5|nr:DUF1800 domain-containing protein [Williamsia sp. CHRR-6]MBT0567087.1 DUF1800 domain-containing protein [Williamsia sp. CHRR-6]